MPTGVNVRAQFIPKCRGLASVGQGVEAEQLTVRESRNLRDFQEMQRRIPAKQW